MPINVTVRDTASVEKLQARIAAMAPADRLRLAAGLIEAGKLDLAEALTRDIADELYALQVVNRRPVEAEP